MGGWMGLIGYMDGWMDWINEWIKLPAGGGGVGGLGGSSTGAASAGAADDQICRIIQIQNYIDSYAPWFLPPICR